MCLGVGTEHLGRRTNIPDDSLFEPHHAIAHLQDLIPVVAHEYDGATSFAEVLDSSRQRAWNSPSTVARTSSNT